MLSVSALEEFGNYKFERSESTAVTARPLDFEANQEFARELVATTLNRPIEGSQNIAGASSSRSKRAFYKKIERYAKSFLIFGTHIGVIYLISRFSYKLDKYAKY